jgi:hypothetical protein
MGVRYRKKVGPAWTERGRPPAGYFTKRLAEDWLRETLHEARRGALVGQVRTGATVADAAASGCATSSSTVSASRRRCGSRWEISRTWTEFDPTLRLR